VKKLLKSVYIIYRSYRKIKTGIPLFLDHPVYYCSLQLTAWHRIVCSIWFTWPTSNNNNYQPSLSTTVVQRPNLFAILMLTYTHAPVTRLITIR